MSFAADTALAAAGEGRWTAEVRERWGLRRGVYGGFIAALLARAAGEFAAWPMRTLSIHFLDAPAPGRVELSGRVERQGRSSTALSLSLDQQGRPMARALATAGRWRHDQPEWLDLAPPAAPAPKTLERVGAADPMPEFLRRLDVRWVDGGESRAHNLAWVRADPPHRLDPPLLALLADVWMPPAFTKLGRPAIVPTLDLTIHFRAPAAPDAEWVLADHRSDHSAGGTWTSDGALWAADGALLVQARQLALLRG